MRTSSRRTALSPWERFIALPDDDRRELIDGELVETEVPTELHEFIVAALSFFFRGWVREHGGAAYASGYKIFVDDKRGFIPDLQLYHPKNKAVRAKQGVTSGAPDVAVEILSEGSATYDRRTKLLGYARIGVGEYWIVSPEAQTLERFVLRRGKYVVDEVLTVEDVLSPSKFSGLEIPIAELFSRDVIVKPKATPRR